MITDYFNYYLARPVLSYGKCLVHASSLSMPVSATIRPVGVLAQGKPNKTHVRTCQLKRSNILTSIAILACQVASKAAPYACMIVVWQQVHASCTTFHFLCYPAGCYSPSCTCWLANL